MEPCRRSMAAALLLLLFVGSRLGQDAVAPPLVRVNLDGSPRQRWEPVLRLYEPAYLRRCLRHILDAVVPKWVQVVLRPLADELECFIRKDYAEEIRGVAEALGISVGEVFLLNLSYEITAFCTSIIAQNRNGIIYHGRNLDYEFKDTLANLTIDVQFLKNGQVAYMGTTFVGYVGLWTGQSSHNFTVSGDQRDKGSWWENAVAAFLKRSSLVSWLIRDTLSEAEDFASAILKLAKTPIIADVYYIVGGVLPKEGVVITRNRNGPADIWPLDPIYGEWFRVETNYDHWTTPPPSDDRRTAAIKALNATGQENINLDTLYKVLSVKPVLNNCTIYTTIMSAAYPDWYLTRIRRDHM